MDDCLNIMFIGGAKRISLAERFLDAGSILGKNINFFSYELSKEVPICSIAKIIVGLKWKDENILDHLSKTIEENDIHIIIPNVDPAIGILASLKGKLNNKKRLILVSEKKICDIFFNKKIANQWFIENDFIVPENSTDNFPLILKPIKGSASRGIKIINSKEEFKNYNISEINENYLIQRFIESDEYTVDCYISTKTNEVLSIVPRKRLEVIDGEVSKSITVYNQELIDISERIIKKSGFSGPINIQFLIEKNTNNIYLMEINPRFGGGVINSIEAGANMPLMVLNDYLGIKNNKIENWRSNILMMRANREVFLCK